MVEQLTLSGIKAREYASFDSYYPGSNQQTVSYLKQFIQDSEEMFVFLWGSRDCGRSHLLQACCEYANENNQASIYLPLQEFKDQFPQLLQGMESLNLVCIDDIHLVVGDELWEEQLFHLYNRLREVNHKLIVSSECSPRELAIKLADLRSRLTWGTVFQLQSLSDEEKIQALQVKGQARGMALTREVAQFLLRRCPRDTGALFAVLNQLDDASLAEQRRLTIPFVKEVLDV